MCTPGHPGGLLIAGRRKPQLRMVPESHCPSPLSSTGQMFLGNPMASHSPKWFKAPSYEEAGKNKAEASTRHKSLESQEAAGCSRLREVHYKYI